MPLFSYHELHIILHRNQFFLWSDRRKKPLGWNKYCARYCGWETKFGLENPRNGLLCALNLGNVENSWNVAVRLFDAIDCDLLIIALAFIQMCVAVDAKEARMWRTMAQIRRRYFRFLCAIYVIETILCASFWFYFSPVFRGVRVCIYVRLYWPAQSLCLLHEIIIMAK